jgi:hypothetical protein
MSVGKAIKLGHIKLTPDNILVRFHPVIGHEGP